MEKRNMKMVKVIIDRPKGYVDKFGNVYPLNYGFVPGIIAGDGEEQDAYILGVDDPISEYEGNLIAIIRRTDDVEDKWVVSKYTYSRDEIRKAVNFIEQYFESDIELLQ